MLQCLFPCALAVQLFFRAAAVRSIEVRRMLSPFMNEQEVQQLLSSGGTPSLDDSLCWPMYDEDHHDVHVDHDVNVADVNVADNVCAGAIGSDLWKLTACPDQLCHGHGVCDGGANKLGDRYRYKCNTCGVYWNQTRPSLISSALGRNVYLRTASSPRVRGYKCRTCGGKKNRELMRGGETACTCIRKFKPRLDVKATPLLTVVVRSAAAAAPVIVKAARRCVIAYGVPKAARLTSEDSFDVPRLTNECSGTRRSWLPTRSDDALQVELRRGLLNLGQTCFMNASLQAFLVIPVVRQQLSQIDLAEPSEGDAFSPVHALATLEHRLRGKGAAVLPREFYDQLWPKASRGQRRSSAPTGALGNDGLRQKTQCDPEEFLTKLFDTIGRSDALYRLVCGTQLSHVHCSGCDNDKPDPSGAQPFIFLTLPVGTGTLDIESAIETYARGVYLSGADKPHCERPCGEKFDATKYFSFESLPEVLMLQLERFGACATKNLSHVSFDETLRTSGCVYRLCSVVMHSGGQSTSSGHYFAYTRCGDEWLKKDDETVQTMSWQTVRRSDRTAQAYLLMYEKCGAAVTLDRHLPLRAGDGATHKPQAAPQKLLATAAAGTHWFSPPSSFQPVLPSLLAEANAPYTFLTPLQQLEKSGFVVLPGRGRPLLSMLQDFVSTLSFTKMDLMTKSQPDKLRRLHRIDKVRESHIHTTLLSFGSHLMTEITGSYCPMYKPTVLGTHEGALDQKRHIDDYRADTYGVLIAIQPRRVGFVRRDTMAKLPRAGDILVFDARECHFGTAHSGSAACVEFAAHMFGGTGIDPNKLEDTYSCAE